MSATAGDGSVDDQTLKAWSVHLGRPVTDPDGLRADLSAGDLPRAFEATARRSPESPALRIDESEITHGELNHRAGVVASTLHRIGIQQDEVILLVAPTSIELVVGYLASLRVRAAVTIASSSNTQAEIAAMWRASGASLVVGTGEGLRTLDSKVTSQARAVIGLSPTDAASADILPSDTDPLPTEPIEGNRIAIKAFTSGSTGEPKCVPLSHRNLLSSIRGVMAAWRWTARDVLVHSLPVTHQHGLGGVHATLLAGSRATILTRFDPESLLETLAEESATAMFAVPAIYQRLVTEAPNRIGHLSGLRFFTSGSAPLEAPLAESIRRHVGEMPLERYGSTEAGLDVSNPITGPRKPGTVGLPLPGVEVRLREEAEEGEVLIRGPQVFDGYLPPDDSAFESGWFRTGDIGRRDEDGYLSIVGRSKELIITGGMNVYPREVEEALRGNGVIDIAVVGVPSRRWGEEVVCFVTPPNAIAVVETRARELLSPHKRPKRVLAIESIPRNPMGKPDRAALRRLASAS